MHDEQTHTPPPPGWRAEAGTLTEETRVQGRGLHTGRKVTVRILPVPPDAARQGIVFRRIQTTRGSSRVLAELPVSPSAWCQQPLCSTLRAENGVMIRTVEHLLAALLLCEIDEAVIELDAEEVPILDGGARTWIRAITTCGRSPLPRPKRFIRVLRPFVAKFKNPDTRYTIDPHPEYTLSCTAKIKDFGRMTWSGVIHPDSFFQEVAAARSYGHVKLALPAILGGFLIGKPILRGARLGSTAAIFNKCVIGGMTLPDEFARHKALDLIGDFALAGAPLLASVRAYRPSHQRNQATIAALLATPDTWEWMECNIHEYQKNI